MNDSNWEERLSKRPAAVARRAACMMMAALALWLTHKLRLEKGDDKKQPEPATSWSAGKAKTMTSNRRK